MRFLIDAQLPPALADWLRKSGHDADHVRDVALLDASDDAIRLQAHRTAAILVTKDRDFLPRRDSDRAIQVIWVRTGNMTSRALLDRMAVAWPEIVTHLSNGERLVEFR